MAASVVLHSLLGGVIPLFSKKLYERFDMGWPYSILGIVALVLSPMPWTIYRLGLEGMRRRFGGGATTEK